MSMFGALNRFISRLDAEPQVQEKSKSQTGFGFQVLRNSNTNVAIEPWFDFVVGINGRSIDNGDANLFATEVRNCAGASVELGLWSAKGQRNRSLYVAVPADSASLGLSLQWTPLSATEDVWHILDVIPNSPADVAGLLPYGDYIIGSPEGLMKTESGLGELVEQYISKPLQLHAYNHEYNVTRLVTIEPSRTWGGTGALGCVLGFGALHRIPAPLDEPPVGPGETLFETARLSSDMPPDSAAEPGGEAAASQYLVPAEMNLPVSSPPAAGGPPSGTGRRGRAHHHHAQKGPAMDMDAFFEEGEAKSKEQDAAPSPKPGTAIAPPPKAGPPKAGPPKGAAAAEEEASAGG